MSDRFRVTCHNAGGYLPVLARSPVVLEPSGFKTIVVGGGGEAAPAAAHGR